jgi:hypothetical protein
MKKPAPGFPARAFKILATLVICQCFARHGKLFLASYFWSRWLLVAAEIYDAGLTGCAGFGPGAAGSISVFGAVGVTLAPTACAASVVVA